MARDAFCEDLAWVGSLLVHSGRNKFIFICDEVKLQL